MTSVADISQYLDKLAPEALAEPWDNVGLQVGLEGLEVERLLVCLDVTDAVLKEAISKNCQLIVAHHPLFFREVTGVTGATSTGRLAMLAIENGLAVYVAHTNLDKAAGGISDSLASSLGLVDVKVLSSQDHLLKLVVFVPQDVLERVKKALGNAGAGTIGLYSHCSFGVAGNGSFRPLAGAHPSLGNVGRDNQVDEVRLEVEVRKTDLRKVSEAMIAAHPYEEVAYDIYELKNSDWSTGLGRIGNLKKEIGFDDFVKTCKNQISGRIRVSGFVERVKRVAVCGGSGSSLINVAAGVGADVMVTGDIKYHDALSARDLGLALVDGGHDATEFAGILSLSERLSGEFDVDVVAPRLNSSIWQEVE